MTKAALQAQIDGFTDGGLNTAAEFRTFATELLNDAYGSVSVEQVSGIGVNVTNTVNNGTNHYYRLNIVKQGRIVYVSGQLTNKTGSTVSNEQWCEFINDFAQDSTPLTFYGVSSLGTIIECQMFGSDLIVKSALGNNQSINIIPFHFYTAS